MNIQGRVQNGVVVLDGGQALPEGTVVVVSYNEKALDRTKSGQRVQFPLVRSKFPGSIDLTGDKIGEILSDEDASACRAAIAYDGGIEQNPYNPPQVAPLANTNRDERMLRSCIATSKRWRAKPPTFLSRRLLRMLMFFAVVGAASIYLLAAIGAPPEYWFLTGGMCLGGAIANIAMARRVARYWPIQEPLMDWEKIDAQARELGI